MLPLKHEHHSVTNHLQIYYLFRNVFRLTMSDNIKATLYEVADGTSPKGPAGNDGSIPIPWRQHEPQAQRFSHACLNITNTHYSFVAVSLLKENIIQKWMQCCSVTVTTSLEINVFYIQRQTLSNLVRVTILYPLMQQQVPFSQQDRV